jgi:hexosaminidase
MINLSSENNLPEIYYTHDGSNPSTSSLKYSAPIQIDQTTTIHAGAFINGELVSKVTKQKLIIHKAFGKKVETLAPYAKKYSSSEEFAMVDGMTGSNHFSDSRWQGYEEVDFEAVIDLGEEKIINKLSSNYYQKIQSWIFMPKYVEYFVSNDGKQFTNVAKIINEISENDGAVLIQEFSVNLEKFKTRYIKVFAKNIEVCPDGHRGAGGKAWIFVDEIIVE